MDLKKLRKKIDNVDDNIIKLLNDRTEAALEIGKIKKEKSMEYYVPSREQAVLERIQEQNKGLFPQSSLRNIYNEIMSATRALEHPPKIAYFGPEATFTHQASLKLFGNASTYIPQKTIKDVFVEVEHNRADYGVVPIENSTEGVVNYTLDMFVDSNLKIYSEIFIEISLFLLSLSEKSKIKKIYSHFQPIAQSRDWLERNFSNTEIIEVVSTAEASILAGKEPGSAAIASELAAKIYGLNIIAESIEDNIDNYTRFLVIGKSINQKTKYNKTSIMFSVKDKVGALHNSLKPFEKYKINLTKIESRPSRKKVWEYIFFVDFNGHVEEKNVIKALAELEKECTLLKVLGSYPEYKQDLSGVRHRRIRF